MEDTNFAGFLAEASAKYRDIKAEGLDLRIGQVFSNALFEYDSLASLFLSLHAKHDPFYSKGSEVEDEKELADWLLEVAEFYRHKETIQS